MIWPCCKPECPAQGDLHVCRVHDPVKVIERVKAIVEKHFEAMRSSITDQSSSAFLELQESILRDLESTI